MLPLNIALGPKAVNFILDNHDNKAKMEQHCLLYTEKMIERYMEIDIDSAESLMEYIDAHEGEMGFSKRIADKLTANEPLEQLLARMCPKEEKAFPSNIVILFEDENGREVMALGNKKTNIVTTNEIKNKRKNIYTMLSPDTGSLDVEYGEDCRYWSEYFSRIIEGEKSVIFMNRYGLSQDAIQSLKKYYLPNLDTGTKIVLYASDTDISTTRDAVIKKIRDDENLKSLNIELYLIDEPRTQHERWIQTDNYYIYQGKGFGMLSYNKAEKISTSSTVIVERRYRKLPSATRVI